MAFQEPRGINIPDFLPSNMDGGIGEAIEGVGRDLDNVAQGARDVAMTMQHLENEEVEQLTRDGLSDFATHTYKQQIYQPGTMNEEAFNQDIESYIAGSEDLQKNEKAADKFREAARQRILPDWHKTELGVKVRDVRTSQKKYNDKFFAPLAYEPSVEYIEAADAVLSSIEFIEDLDGAPPDHIEELENDTIRNWMALASRAVTKEEFMLHAAELVSESGDTSLRLPSEWINSQKASYDNKGMSTTGKQLAEGYLNEVAQGKVLSGKKLSIMASAREASPEFGAKYISAAMVGMSDVVWPTVPPEEWDRMLKYIDPKNGAFWHPRHDKSAVEEEFGQALNAIWEVATDGASQTELDLLSKVEGQKKLFDHLSAQMEEKKKEAGLSFPDYMAKHNPLIAETYKKLYAKGATQEQLGAARAEIYQLSGRVDDKGKRIPEAEDRNWAFGVARLKDIFTDVANTTQGEMEEGILIYKLINGSASRAINGIGYVLNNNDQKLTDSEYEGLAYTIFDVATSGQVTDDKFTKAMYDSFDKGWRKEYNKEGTSFAEERTKFRENYNTSATVKGFVESLATMEDLAGHAELQLAVQNMITNVAMFTDSTEGPDAAWSMVEGYINRNFTHVRVPLSLGSVYHNQNIVLRALGIAPDGVLSGAIQADAYHYSGIGVFNDPGAIDPSLAQDDLQMLFPKSVLNEWKIGFFDRAKMNESGYGSMEKGQEILGTAMMVPMMLPTDMGAGHAMDKFRIDFGNLDLEVINSAVDNALKALPEGSPAKKELEKAAGERRKMIWMQVPGFQNSIPWLVKSEDRALRNHLIVSMIGRPARGTNEKGQETVYYTLKSKDAPDHQPLRYQGKDGKPGPRVEFVLEDLVDGTIRNSVGYKWFETPAGSAIRTGLEYEEDIREGRIQVIPGGVAVPNSMIEDVKGIVWPEGTDSLEFDHTLEDEKKLRRSPVTGRVIKDKE